jgi:hypothetical protein
VLGQVGDDLGPDPRGRGGEGGLVLGHPVDPQERRVLVGEAEKAPAAISTRKLRFVRPASMGVIVGSCPRHPGTPATTASRSGSRATAG